MSRLQSVNDYLRELAEVDQMLALEDEFNQTLGEEPASQLIITSLRNRRQSIVAEMEALGDEQMPQQEIAVLFEGQPVTEYSVDAGFLGTMLRDLQRVVESIAASAAGSTARRGLINKKIKQRSTLRFAGSFAGSFGMLLETAAEEFPLDDTGSVTRSLESLVCLLQADEDDRELLDRIAPLNARARANYMVLLEHLSGSNASMRFQWSSVGGVREASLEPSSALRVLERLRRVQIEEDLKTYTGRLDGAIASKALFAFIAEDGTRFEGQIAPSLVSRLSEFRVEQPCTALISTRRITDLTTGDVRVQHKLEELEPEQANLPADSE